MYTKNTLKKIFVTSIICILLMIYFTPVNARNINDKKENIKADERWASRFGFIIGPYESKALDGDLLVILAGFQASPGRSLNYLALFRHGHLHQGQQIRLVQSNKCIFINNFIMGICKIYFPRSEISMHVSSQNEQENEIIWEIDEIIGDKIWESNIDVELYTESGEKYHNSYSYGPLGEEYLSIGNQISIKPTIDGYYSVKFIESISGDLLFKSPLLKY